MYEPKRVEFDLPPGCDSRLVAYSFVRMLREYAETADESELLYLANTVMNLANDLAFAASEAGADQRRRLSTNPSVWHGLLPTRAA